MFKMRSLTGEAGCDSGKSAHGHGKAAKDLQFDDVKLAFLFDDAKYQEMRQKIDRLLVQNERKMRNVSPAPPAKVTDASFARIRAAIDKLQKLVIDNEGVRAYHSKYERQFKAISNEVDYAYAVHTRFDPQKAAPIATNDRKSPKKRKRVKTLNSLSVFTQQQGAVSP